MVNFMQEQNIDEYALRTTCEDITLLLPLSSVYRILASDDKELRREHHKMVSYKGRSYPVFSMLELLHKEKTQEERYVILLQNEDIEAALYVTLADEVIKPGNTMMKLPAYLQTLQRSYITGCCLLKDKTLAYVIEFLKLLQRSDFIQEEAYEN